MAQRAVRVQLTGTGAGDELRDAVVSRARELGAMGWVRTTGADSAEVHAEGDPEAIAALLELVGGGPAEASVDEAKVEGHEQFAIRGVPAGVFVVREHAATSRHFDLRLEVDGTMRSWAVPKGPSMDPAEKRLAVELQDHDPADNLTEGALGDGAAIVWDRGAYEQGGRVPWPEALERGHAVFVLHGGKLRGGFALQRTRPGTKPRWLLIKRRDDEAMPGSDVVAEEPESVLSGKTLDELLA